MPFNDRSVLIIEDDEPKLKSVFGLLVELGLESSQILVAGSLSSAVAALSENVIDLAVVDMSLPTYDFATDRRGGGVPQGFGGMDILRFIETESPSTKSLVLTQYEQIQIGGGGGPKRLVDIEGELRSELGDRFLGIIHYEGQQGEWRERLSDLVLAAMEDGQ